MEFETYGIDLNKYIELCKEKGNTDLAELIEKQIKNLQACFDVIGERYSSCPDEDITKIDKEYLLSRLV